MHRDMRVKLDQAVAMTNEAEDREKAEALVAAHGERARQAVVDQIVIAIRAHDLNRAKRWDAVGQLVDQRLAVAA